MEERISRLGYLVIIIPQEHQHNREQFIHHLPRILRILHVPSSTPGTPGAQLFAAEQQLDRRRRHHLRHAHGRLVVAPLADVHQAEQPQALDELHLGQRVHALQDQLVDAAAGALEVLGVAEEVEEEGVVAVVGDEGDVDPADEEAHDVQGHRDIGRPGA